MAHRLCSVHYGSFCGLWFAASCLFPWAPTGVLHAHPAVGQMFSLDVQSLLGVL